MKNLIFALTCIVLSACANSSSQTPEKPATPTADSPAGETTCSRTAVSDDYESTHTTTKDTWIRDAGKDGFTVVTKKPILIDGSLASAGGSEFAVGFKNGKQIDPDADNLTSDDGAYCFAFISLSDDDFDTYIKTKKYPSYVLTPRAIRGQTVQWGESSESGKEICAEPKSTTESRYEIRLTPTALLTPSGKRTQTKVTSLRCTGHDQRLSSLARVFGIDAVESTSPGQLPVCPMAQADAIKQKRLGAMTINRDLNEADAKDAQLVVDRLKSCRANSVMLIEHCLAKTAPPYSCPTPTSFYETYENPFAVTVGGTTILGPRLTIKVDSAKAPLQAVIYKRALGESANDLETSDDAELLRIDLR